MVIFKELARNCGVFSQFTHNLARIGCQVQPVYVVRLQCFSASSLVLIDLSNNSLVGEIPSFGKLLSLLRLNLAYNNLKVSYLKKLV